METYDDVKIQLSVPGPSQEPEAFSIPRSSSSLQVELTILRREENMWVKIFPDGSASIEDIHVVEDLPIKVAPIDYQTLLLMSMSGDDHPNVVIFRQRFSDQVLFPMGVQPGLHDDIIHEIVEFVGGIQDWLSRLPPGTVLPLRLTLTARFFHVPSDQVPDEKGTMIPATTESIRALKRVTTLEDDEKCVICLEELVDGSEGTVMPCSHLFHGSCITAWLEQSHLCPLCRFQMPTSTSFFHPLN